MTAFGNVQSLARHEADTCSVMLWLLVLFGGRLPMLLWLCPGLVRKCIPNTMTHSAHEK